MPSSDSSAVRASVQACLTLPGSNPDVSPKFSPTYLDFFGLKLKTGLVIHMLENGKLQPQNSEQEQEKPRYIIE